MHYERADGQTVEYDYDGRGIPTGHIVRTAAGSQVIGPDTPQRDQKLQRWYDDAADMEADAAADMEADQKLQRWDAAADTEADQKLQRWDAAAAADMEAHPAPEQ